MIHFCKKCGKEHAPKCDRCGSTRDLRSFHGPCGSCAFGKAKTSAMRDELAKIAAVKKKATIIKLAFIANTLHTVGNTVKAFANPVKNTVKGWNHKSNAGVWKAVGVLGTAVALPSALKKEDPSGEHQTRLQRLGRVAGGTIGGTIGMSVGKGAGLVSGVTGSVIGERAGKAVGSAGSAVARAITGKKKAPPAPQPFENPPVAAQPPPQP